MDSPGKLIVLGCMVACIGTQAQQPCDATIRPVDDPNLAYQPTRVPTVCEGFYQADVASSIRLVGMMYGPLSLPQDTSEIEIVYPGLYDGIIFVRAQAMALRTYYQMDAQLGSSKRISWPLEKVHKAEVLGRDLAMYGYTSKEEPVYLPLTTNLQAEKSSKQPALRIYFKTTEDLKDISYKLVREGESMSEPKRAPISSVDAGTPIIIPLGNLANGLYSFLLWGTVKGSDQTLSTSLAFLINETPR